jgi:GNAT superfamily N-acetyltransferase
MFDIGPIEASGLAEVLPLVAAYQRFYEVDPDDARNASFFRRFVRAGARDDVGDDGLMLGARDVESGALVGYACLHWRLDTVEAREIVCLHDLYVVPEERSTGAGRALLEASADLARRRGVPSLVWSTAPGNVTAQRLYDATGAARSEWFEYDLRV